jgi:hypothetical protein
VYSLACVLHEMLIGAPPLLDRQRASSRGPKAFAAKLRERGIPRRAARRLSEAICRALEPEPDERFATIDDFDAALRTVQLPAERDSGAGVRRSNAMVAVAGLLMAVAVVAFLWFRSPSLEPNRVAVGGFRAPADDQALAALEPVFGGWVTQALSARSGLEVVAEPIRGEVGRAKARAAARRARAAFVVVGSFYRERDSLRFQLQVLDGGSGAVARVLDGITAPAAAPSEAAEAVRRRIGAVVDSLAAVRDR